LRHAVVPRRAGGRHQGHRDRHTHQPNDAVLHVSLAFLSSGHYLARNYEKSAEVASLAVQRGPNYPQGWRCLAPGYSEQTARFMTFRDEAVFQHWLEGLRKAGWEG